MAWESSGVPGAPTRTTWFERDVPAMWRVLENQQSDNHWRLVAGWRKAADLTATHLRRLEQYRANLAEAWPPDRSTAAAAYVSRLDFLIQNVRATHEVAAANYSTLAATVGALALARRDLEPLYDEYVTKARAMKAHAELAAFNAMSEGPGVIGAAPAGPGDLERLNNRARAIMYTLSHTLVEAEAAIRQPPAYQPTTDKNIGEPDAYGSTATTAGTARESQSKTRAVREVRQNGRPSVPVLPSDSHAPSPWDSTLPPRRGFAGTQETPGPTESISRTSNATSKRTPSPISADGVIGPRLPLATSEANAGRTGPYVNPAGGMIGGTPRTRPEVGHPGPTQPLLGVSGGRPVEGTKHPIDRRYQDTHWEVAEGVPPVITPATRSTRIDTGPAIGLIP